jgi:hypothetical protein
MRTFQSEVAVARQSQLESIITFLAEYYLIKFGWQQHTLGCRYLSDFTL